MLEAFLPTPRLIEVDEVTIAAPPERVWPHLRHLDGTRSALVRALFELRLVPDRIAGRMHGRAHLSIDDLPQDRPGFRILAELPGVEVAVGAIGKFWQPAMEFADVAPADFAGFATPGFARVAWSLLVEPWGDGDARVRLELRLDATDEDAWVHVRRYFGRIGPFSRFIRRHLLAGLAEELGTPEGVEQTRALPGDHWIADPRASVTDGITIAAEPAAIWPWLLQMGCGRAGWYSYDRLDNAGVPSAEVLVPAWQELAVGDRLPARPQGDDGFDVLELDPERLLVLGGLYDLEHGAQLAFDAEVPATWWRASWAFVLERLEPGRTRLHVRARVDFSDGVGLRALWMRPVHHFMQREQLRNLARRAEGRVAHAHDGIADVGEGIVGALAMLASLATPFLRRSRAHWGIDAALAARPYPGDDRVPTPRWSWTHAVEIDAPMAAVWPWVAQIGQGRAGFYSYQWLENVVGCDVHNAEDVHSEWTEIRVGDALRLHPDMPPLSVVAVEPGQWWVAHAHHGDGDGGAGDPIPGRVSMSWLFHLEALPGGRTRFVSRMRSDYAGDWRAALAQGPWLLEPIGFVMDRRMLLGVKARVERGLRRAADTGS